MDARKPGEWPPRSGAGGEEASYFTSCRLYLFTLLLLLLRFPLLAAGPHGTDVGWTVDHSSGQILFTSTLANQLAAGGTGWVRVEMSLVSGHSTWDATMLNYYDTVVNNARNAGLQVLMVIDGGSWPGGQTAWCTNNAENTPGANGDNPFVEAYATNAVLPLVQHFRDRVKYYELWNEPNCWSSNYNTFYYGCTYIYPSNYGWLLARSWTAVHVTQQINDVTLFSGGVFGHNIGGTTSYANAGAQYIDDTYSTGTNVHKGGSFNYTKTNSAAYPLDGVGEHIYLSQGGTVSSNTFRQYEDWVHQAVTKYEGTNTPKKTFITEFGWDTSNVSQSVQDTDLVTAFSAIQATPYVQTAIWFQWKDNPAGNLYFGVLDSSNTPKLSYPDYQRFERFEGIYADASTNTPIQTYFRTTGQPALGCPYDNGHGAYVYTNLNGYAQDFAGGSHSNLTVMTSSYGTFEVNNLHGLWNYYLAHNGLSLYGAPLTNAYTSGSGIRQDFFQGYLTWDAANQIVWHQVLGAPPAPAGVAAVAGNGQITLSWNTAPIATSYNLKRSTTSGGPYSLVASVVTPTVYTDAPLLNGTSYFYVVTAVNQNGESTNSLQVSATPNAALANLPAPWQTTDVGNVNLSGAAGCSSGVFSVKGAGTNISAGADSFHFVYQSLTGDATLIARVLALQSTTNLDPSAKAGVMFRESLAPGSIEVATVLTASNGVQREYRMLNNGGTTVSPGPALSIPHWLKLVRAGNTFTTSTSSDGVTFTTLGSSTLTMAGTALVGLAVCSHNANALDTAAFDNVLVASPPAITAQPQPQTAVQGSTIAFTVTATNPAPLYYQWRWNSSAIPNATASTYTVLNAQPANAGTYDVVITNALYAITSAPAALTVRPILTLSAQRALTWSGSFVLQSATNVLGPYSDVPGAQSPFTPSTASPRQFFRLRN